MGPLPSGWSIERLRELGGATEFDVVEQTSLVAYQVASASGSGDLQKFTIDAAIDFAGLWLVHSTADDQWWMGQAGDDGEIICWSSYGTDLEEAFGGL